MYLIIAFALESALELDCSRLLLALWLLVFLRFVERIFVKSFLFLCVQPYLYILVCFFSSAEFCRGFGYPIPVTATFCYC